MSNTWDMVATGQLGCEVGRDMDGHCILALGWSIDVIMKEIFTF
jgi:hypothetical protein